MRWHPRARACVQAVRRARHAAPLLVLALAFALLGPSAAGAITRNEVIARAQSVINNPVPYSQSRFTGGWRNDCSGYVSWCWGTGSNSYVTANMSSISTHIAKEQLQPGDCLLKAGTHVILFYAWADDAHTTYVAYEQTPPRTWSSVRNVAADISAGYIPYRYDDITDSPAPWPVGKNANFDVWNKGTNKSDDPPPSSWTPVWWSFGTNGAGTSWQIRGDLVSSPAWALGLTNLTTSAGTIAEARQFSPATPGKGYTLLANAQTTSKPSAVLLCLQFYDASNKLLKDVRVTGDKAGLGSGAFRPMSVTTTAPAGATRADSILALWGATNPAGGAGGTAVFDDVYFYVSSPLPVYRFFNPHTGAHFYTASGPERDVVINTLADTFTYEGPAYGVVATAANNSPLFRFYNHANGTHFYTASAAEADNVKKTLSATYSYDGPVYNVCIKQVPGALPVYRFYNRKNGSHFYTNSEAEKELVKSQLSAIYTFEGPAFFLAQ